MDESAGGSDEPDAPQDARPAGEPDGRPPTSPDPSALAILVPTAALVPLSYVVLYPAYRLLALLVELPPYPVSFLFYVAFGLVTLARGVQLLLLGGLFGARRPTASEREALQPAWEAVLRRADLAPERFLLTVVDSPELNAAATGGSVVTVTTAALELPRAELEGTLAHELGHHVGPHTYALPLAHWLVTPVAWLGELGRRMSRMSCLVSGVSVVALVFGIGALGIVFGLAAAVIGLILLVAGETAGSLGGLVGRFSEHSADRTAVDLGFGPQLAAALDRFSRRREGSESRTGSKRKGKRKDKGADARRADESVSVGQRIFGSHPPLRRRLSRVRGRMARRGEG